MGSSKKHKRNKSGRREKYEEYSNNYDTTQLQCGLKLILKVGSNSTPEYNESSHIASQSAGPPTAAEAMMSPAPISPMAEDFKSWTYRDRHKKSKKKKKKKDREKKHKHHKDKRRIEHQSSKEKELGSDKQLYSNGDFIQQQSPENTQPLSALQTDMDSTNGGVSFNADNVMIYSGITTDHSPSNKPITKSIIPVKYEDSLLVPSSIPSPCCDNLIKPPPNLIIPSTSPPVTPTLCSTSTVMLTTKALDALKTPSTLVESGREPRSCVLKLKQQKAPLNRLLEHILRSLEKRDPHQFFAWPVTDDIAPGYSNIISKPMDFSTMRQKIDSLSYTTLSEFVEDFSLMCENAIRYNHVDTVYHKAAKRLMQVGMKQLQPDNLMRSLKPLSVYMRELTSKELGFELIQNEFSVCDHDSEDENASIGVDEQTQLEAEEHKLDFRSEKEPKTRFEPYSDDLTSDEILVQVQDAAQKAKKKAQKKANQFGFLRQNKDGTTSLNLVIKDVNEGPEKVITIGEIVGKLKAGSGQIQGLREDKRNNVKLVKHLDYGVFASFAPVFDSRFANLSAEETQLMLGTYGDAASTEYADSILQFTKDSMYATTLANGLLDIMTNGEHSKSLKELQNIQIQRHEEYEIKKYFRCYENSQGLNLANSDNREQIEMEYEKYKYTRVDFNQLRSLKSIGIDTGFLDAMETDIKNFELTRRLQEHLNNNLSLIEKLRLTQSERLSQPLPVHLSLVQQASQEEIHLAHQITQQLSDLAKRLPPSAITDGYSLRKAMGISYVGLPQPSHTLKPSSLPETLQQPVQSPQLHMSNINYISTNNLPMDVDVDSSNSGVDLENELRQFLESGSGLHTANTVDENNIVAQLLLN